MKKTIPLLVSALMLLSLAACGSKTTTPETTTAPTASGGKTLVSVFSSTDRAAVEARKRALAGVNNELWIYEKP